jgi:hypothetical protein
MIGRVAHAFVQCYKVNAVRIEQRTIIISEPGILSSHFSRVVLTILIRAAQSHRATGPSCAAQNANSIIHCRRPSV